MRFMKVLLATVSATLIAVALTGFYVYSTSPFPEPKDALERDPAPLARRLGKPDVSVRGYDFTWISSGVLFSTTLRVVYTPIGAGYAPAPFAEKMLWIGDPRGRGFKVFGKGAAIA
jgi:hypothetical protein